MKKSLLILPLALALLASSCAQTPAPVAPASRDEALSRLDFRQVVQAAKDKVFPAVVFIKCLQETMETGKKVTQAVAGSGVAISPSGEVLTNRHVVDKAVEIRCLLRDGRAMNARIIGTDKDTDLALLQLELPKDAKTVPYAELGEDSCKLKEGDFVMAMGAPWGLARSVSIGIISCTCRYLPGSSEYSLWLQTDASICPGNSGGPLVNTDGKVVGINALAITRGGDMGFAIPAETLRLVAERLRQFKEMNWSWTGIQLQPLKDFDKNIYFDADSGVIVAETDPESPARRAGLRMHDRITRINGQPVTGEREEDLPAIRRILGLLPKNEKAAFELVREGQVLQFEIVPRVKGKVEGEELDCPRWDFTVKSINQFDNPDLHFYRTKGVFVYGIKYPGNAAQSGLADQDIILKIDGKEVTTLDDVKAIHEASLKTVKDKHRIVIVLLRGGLERQVVLDFGRNYERE